MTQHDPALTSITGTVDCASAYFSAFKIAFDATVRFCARCMEPAAIESALNDLLRAHGALQTSPAVWLTLDDLADRWKVCKKTILRMPLNRLVYFKIGGSRRYRMADVLTYEDSCRILKGDR